MLVNGRLSLDYTENILDSLLTNSLSSLSGGDRIVIEKKSNHSVENDYNISIFKIIINDSNGGILNEREFIKSYWMEI